MPSAKSGSGVSYSERADESENLATTPQIGSSETTAAILVGAFAAVVRAIWVLLASRVPVGLSDPSIYLQAAASIADGNGYTSLLGRPTAYYPPGYPFFVAGVQRVAEFLGQGSHLVLILGLTQAVLGGVAAAALVVAGCRIRRGVWLGVVAGLLFALWPNLIIHSGLVLSESLYLCCFCVLLAALCTWTLRLQSPHIGRSGAVVFVLILSTALCTLVRPQSVAMVLPAAALAWLMSGFGWRSALRGLGLLLVGMLIAVLPWTLRNAVVLKGFVPMSTNTGDNLCIGFHDGATGGFSITPECATEGNYTDGPDVELARDRELRSRTLRWIAAHPGEIPELSYKKLRITLSHDADAVSAWESYGEDAHLSSGQRSLLIWISNAYYWIVALLGVGGAGIVLRQWVIQRKLDTSSAAIGNGLMTLFICIFGAFLPVLFFGDERFKISILPCLALLAAQSICAVSRLSGSGSLGATNNAQGHVDAESDPESDAERVLTSD
jgi:hypothetical protein